jgi:hypothetical protein
VKKPKLYRPSNGSEGMDFEHRWCEQCKHDSAYRDEPEQDPALSCQIFNAAFLYEKDDPQYPKEWVYGADGRPCCTAFESKRLETNGT